MSSEKEIILHVSTEFIEAVKIGDITKTPGLTWNYGISRCNGLYEARVLTKYNAYGLLLFRKTGYAYYYIEPTCQKCKVLYDMALMELEVVNG